MRVYVVEDDRDVSHLARLLLTREGWDVECEQDARIAIDRDISGFDAVLVDVQMPYHTGQEVLAVYAEKYPHVRRVLWTAGEATTPGHADAVIFKPAEWTDITAALEGNQRD